MMTREVRRGFLIGGRATLPQLAHRRQLHHAKDIQNHRNPPVSHDAGAGENAHSMKPLTERLYDDLLGVIDLIDHQTKLLVTDLQHDDMCRVVGRGYRASRGKLQQIGQIDQGQQISAQPADRRAVDELDAPLALAALEAHQLD